MPVLADNRTVTATEKVSTGSEEIPRADKVKPGFVMKKKELDPCI